MIISALREEKGTSPVSSSSQIKPDSLLGIVENLTDLASQALPNIFRYWQEKGQGSKFLDFLNFLDNCVDQDYTFNTIDISERESTVKLNPSTANAMLRQLAQANVYFENPSGNDISAKDILQEGKMTVINVANSIDFGSIVLRFLLNNIVIEKKDNMRKVIACRISIIAIHY